MIYDMEITDLCMLDDVTEEGSVECLKTRFEAGKYYSWIGDILLFINPYKKLQENTQFSTVSRNLLNQLFTTSENQCLIVTGESGSGKTEISKKVFERFSSQILNSDYKLVQKIKNISTILDAFGNAKTILNDNATRYGKYLQLYFSESGRLLLAHITQYLLEKSRVLQQRKEEQNFHVFYYLFSGRTDEELSKHLLDLPTQHKYLKHGEAFGENESDWGRNYKELIEGFQTFGFSPEEISGVFGILSAILYVGDLKFDMQDEKTGVFIENLDVLDKIATLLGVESDDLELCLTSNMMAVKDDSISSFKNVTEASSCRDSLASTLYSRLFSWVVSRLNTLLDTGDVKKKRSELSSVGFLDMFGFESLHKNSFEQLCINVFNEQLKLHFTQHIFALEIVECSEEDLDFSSIDYMDNKNLIYLLLEQPHGIFALLDEESKCLQADDNTLVSSFNAQWGQHPNFVVSQSTVPLFCIIHHNKKVPYVAEGFLEANGNKCDQGLMDFLKGSKDVITSTLFSSTLTKIGTLSVKPGSGKSFCCHGDLRPAFEKRQKYRKVHERGYNTNKASHNMRTKSKKTLTSKKQKTVSTSGTVFRNSLVDLMEKILLCQAHFVRCMKANKLKETCKFDEEVVLSQIKYFDVQNTIKIRKYGYPVRLSFKIFLDRYRFLFFDLSSIIEYTLENCKLVLHNANIADYKVGKTKIFLQLSQAATLREELRKTTSKVITAQRMVRGHLARVKFDLQSSKKDEDRSVDNFLVSIASKSSKVHDGLILLTEADVKNQQKVREKEMEKKDPDEQQQKRKLMKTVSDIETIKKAEKHGIDSPNRKIPRNKTRTEPMVRNFTTSSMSAWCRVDCFERQFHVASFQMDQAVICVEGTHPVSDKHRVAFASIPGRADDPKVAKVKSCIGKGVQLHQDERQNLWATRLGKNPIFVRGHTLSPELVKLDGKLTQGVPMKVLDTAAFKQYMRDEVESNGSVTDELKEIIMSRLKVCMSFIKDTVVDEETPCWFEVWLLKVKEDVKRYLDNQQKRRAHEEKRRSGNFSSHGIQAEGEKDAFQPSLQPAPEMQRAKSGDQLKQSERRPRSHTALATSSGLKKSIVSQPRPPSQHYPLAPMLGDKQHSQPSMEKALSRLKAMNAENNVPRRITQDELRREKSMEIIRREKSMDVTLEARLLMEREYRNSMRRQGSDKQVSKKLKKGSPSQSPEQSLGRTGSADSRVKDFQMDSTIESRSYNGTSTPSSSDTYSNRATYINNNAATSKGGMSYRQVFGLQSSDYLFNVTPPNYTRHRRFSDSDTESLHNFVHRIIPQDEGKSKVLQPRKWLKKARRKSEDNPKKKVLAQLPSK